VAAVCPGKFLYLATPHTASLATVRALTTIPGCLEVVGPREHEHGQHHATRREIVGDAEVPELVWSVRRNPYDLAVTWYLRHGMNRRRARPSLAEFLAEWNDPPYVVGGRIFWHEADEWLAYEDLGAEVGRLLAGLGLPTVEIPVYNETPGKGPWQSYWTDDAVEALDAKFGAEARAFGYSSPLDAR